MLYSMWEKTGFDIVPRIAKQPRWEQVPLSFRKKLSAAAEHYEDFRWPFLYAVRYMDFARTGNRAVFEDAYFKRRQALAVLVLAECLENEGRFLDDIINGIWCICEESSWVLPAHHNQFYEKGGFHSLPRIQEPVIDLFAAETGALLAWALHLLGPSLGRVSLQVTERIIWELRHRILDPYLNRDDFWWMGFRDDTGNTLGNWVPWTTGNCLRVFLLIEKDDKRRTQAVMKGLQSLDIYLQHYSPDGGCDEGPSYWGRSGGSLFECLEMLYNVTDGVFDPFSDPLIKRIGQYMYRVHIAREYFVNFADGSAKAEVDGPILYSYGKRIQDPSLMSIGVQMYQLYGLEKLMEPKTFSLGRLIRAACLHEEMERYEWRRGCVDLDHWFENLQVMTARETRDPERGFFLSAKGGHNGENHNHNDVGSCIVYYNGHPLLIDVGVETYTAKTFGPHRYEIWTMRSLYHNVPLVNGKEQLPGGQYKATNVNYRRDEQGSHVSFQLERAYPQESGMQKWERRCTLQRDPKPTVVIRDRFQLEYANSIQLVFMTPKEPRAGDDLIYLDTGWEIVAMTYDNSQLDVAWEMIPIDDPLLHSVWGDRVYRLVFEIIEPSLVGEAVFTLRKLEQGGSVR